jgi:hypothetical protein
MATESRDAGVAVTAARQTKQERRAKLSSSIRKMLDEEPFRVHFFQAVRMLQKDGDRTQAGGLLHHAAAGDDSLLSAHFAGVSAQRDLRLKRMPRTAS